MLKGAIYLFAFSIFLFGCATEMTYQPLPAPPPFSPPPVPLPDLTISDLSSGEGEVELVEKQEVSPALENEEKIALLSPPPPPPKPEAPKEPLLLPDLTITNLSLNPQRKLVVTIANIGNGPFPLGNGDLRVLVDGHRKGSYALSGLSDQPFLLPKESITFTAPLTIIGRHEIQASVDTSHEMKEWSKENNMLKKILKGPPIGPDIVVKDLGLTEDLELYILVSNAGEVDLRKGITLRIRIFVNDRKISEFEHFTSEALRANFGNHYTIDPPYRVGIGGISKVKISILPKLPSDDICLENNILERTFIIFPFRIGPQAKQEFSFSVLSPRPKDGGQAEKVKAEARWEGGGSSLMLSFKGSGHIKSVPTLSGKSPLKAEFPIHFEEVRKESLWRVSVTNLVEKKVEGRLIIQHP